MSLLLAVAWGLVAYPVFICFIAIISVITFVLLVVFGRTRYSSSILYAYGKICTYIARVTFGIRFKVVGNQPRDGTIIACNHQSVIDPLAICCVAPNTLFLYKDSLRFAPLLRCLGMVPVDNNKNWLLDTCDIPAENNIGIYPEGRLVEPGETVPYRKGVGVIARATKRLICLACLDSGKNWGRRWLPNPKCFCSTITLRFLGHWPHDTPVDQLQGVIQNAQQAF